MSCPETDVIIHKLRIVDNKKTDTDSRRTDFFFIILTPLAFHALGKTAVEARREKYWFLLLDKSLAPH